MYRKRKRNLDLEESCDAVLSEATYRGCAAYITAACYKSRSLDIYNIVFEGVLMPVITDVVDNIEFSLLDHLYESAKPR